MENTQTCEVQKTPLANNNNLYTPSTKMRENDDPFLYACSQLTKKEHQYHSRTHPRRF